MLHDVLSDGPSLLHRAEELLVEIFSELKLVVIFVLSFFLSSLN